MKNRLPKEVKKIFDVFKENGFEIFAVGGCVRDLVLGKEIKDWDFTTSATPDQILALFPDSFYDNKFGTVGIPIKKRIGGLFTTSEVYEITTYRSESGYKDHRHPEKISWGKTLEEDLKRRDFTINAMAYDGIKIIDLYGGKEDLKSKLVKAVGTPDERFNEDGLRMIRAVRIATQLHFYIEEHTLSAIKKKLPSFDKYFHGKDKG